MLQYYPRDSNRRALTCFFGFPEGESKKNLGYMLDPHKASRQRAKDLELKLTRAETLTNPYSEKLEKLMSR